VRSLVYYHSVANGIFALRAKESGMVGDVAIAEVAEGQQIAFRLTPYTAVPRRLPWFGSSRGRERLGTALIFSFLPTILYWTWLGTEGLRAIPGTYASMRWAAPLSGLFITLGPWLMQQGEFIYEDLLRIITITGADAGYRIEFLRAKIGRLDAIYYRVIIPLGTAMAISIGYVFFSIGKIAPLPSTLDQVGAVVVLAFVGPAAASGVWGAIKVLLIVETITSTAELEGSPFRNSSPAVSQGKLSFPAGISPIESSWVACYGWCRA
jgi:hypothetical protein